MASTPLRLLVSLAFMLSVGCSASGSSPVSSTSALPLVRSASGSPGNYISHIVIIVQENRSFENLFAGFPGANAPTSGCAIPLKKGSGSGSGSGCPPGDIVVALKGVGWKSVDLPHNWDSSKLEYHKGKMDGFSLVSKTHPYAAYSYLKRTLIAPYWDMAQQYVLADAMFPTEWGGSFTGHLTLIAGTDNIKQRPSRAEVDFPNGAPDDCDSPAGTTSSYLTANRVEHRYQGPFPCFDQFETIAAPLDAAGISWKIYATKVLDAGMWEPFEAIKSVRYGADWKSDIIAPQTQVLNDAANGNLASVSWVTPSKQDSDHPGSSGPGGPSWVASVVNAIGESPYWSSTAIVILWDDWGGEYDNAPPPQLDYRGLGFRVPCIIVSPYARETSSSQPGYVSHTQYEYASTLKFIEEVFGLGHIGPKWKGYTDSRAHSLDDSFDFTQPPRTFTAIPSTYSKAHFLHEPPSNDPIDTE